MFANREALFHLFPFMERTPMFAKVHSETSILDSIAPKMLHPNPYIMVFDVETTGLLPKTPSKKKYGNRLTQEEYAAQYFQSPTPPNSLYTGSNDQPLPYITQLSYIIYDLSLGEVVKIYNHYIRLRSDIVIAPEITRITGITQEMCETRGIAMALALEEFARDYVKCQTIVSHNLEFDRGMIQLEMSRHWILGISSTVFNETYDRVNRIGMYCTMMNGRDLCNLYVERKPSPNSKNPEKTWKYKKMPKLVELYKELFRAVPENLHNSLIDTLVCMRCYLKMRHNLDVDEDNFAKMLADALHA